jgi:hypothetical protein
MQGPHHGMLPSSMKPTSRRPLPLDADDTVKAEQQKPKIPVLEEHLVGQLSKEEQGTLDAKFKEASDADKKVYCSVSLFQESLSSFRQNRRKQNYIFEVIFSVPLLFVIVKM